MLKLRQKCEKMKEFSLRMREAPRSALRVRGSRFFSPGSAADSGAHAQHRGARSCITAHASDRAVPLCACAPRRKKPEVRALRMRLIARSGSAHAPL